MEVKSFVDYFMPSSFFCSDDIQQELFDKPPELSTSPFSLSFRQFEMCILKLDNNEYD